MALTKISTDGVKDDAITKAKIPANQIEASELANDAVDTNAIQDDAVTEDKLANSINSAIAANTAKDLTALSASNLTSGTIPDARLPATLPAISGANLTGISTTEAAITGKLGSASHIRQNVATGLTYNGTTGDVSLGSVSNANASSIKSLICFVQCVHSSPSASHGYLSGWIYQTGKTYNADGAFFDVKTYNQYVLHFPTTVIIPWDSSGTQSLNLYISSSTETGSNNYFNIGVDSKLENV
tara:strand:- start:819 stop:1544 length:726 start_codon:yes stop_codon:yes gene_type:complete